MLPASVDTGPLSALSQTFWRQQQLLELLLYRLETQHLVLASNRPRWIEHAAHDVESLMAVLREEELIRAAQVADVAARLGLRPDATLRELTGAAPDPWQEILRDHQRAFLELIDEIETTSRANRDLLRRSLHATRELLGLGRDHDAATTYDRSGVQPARRDPLLVDRDV